MKAYLVVMLLLHALSIVGNIYRLKDGDRPSRPKMILGATVFVSGLFVWTIYLMWDL